VFAFEQRLGDPQEVGHSFSDHLEDGRGDTAHHLQGIVLGGSVADVGEAFTLKCNPKRS
jgi:hypothetical protein